MSERETCPHGNEDCGFNGSQELALTQKIMELIGTFSEDQQLTPCPLCLRDTMLAAAALLHAAGARMPAPMVKHGKARQAARKAFAQAACERFEAVLEAEAGRIGAGKH